MAVVIDANLLVRLASRGEFAPEIAARLGTVLDAGEELHAPHLLPYELESGIRSIVYAGALSEDDAVTGLARAAEIPLVLHPHPGNARILRVAGRQGTKAAYDAAYLELAERLDAELWTLDRRLRHHAEAIGIRVQFVGEPG